MRKLADKSYGIRKDKLMIGIQTDASLGNIQGGKQHIFLKDCLLFPFIFSQQRIHQRRLSGIGVPHQRHHRNL